MNLPASPKRFILYNGQDLGGSVIDLTRQCRISVVCTVYGGGMKIVFK